MSEFDYAFEVKAIDSEDFHVEGLGISVGNIDHGGDIVAAGSFTKALAGLKSLPMLESHDHKKPIGVWTHFRETAAGLEVKGRFDDTHDGRDARTKARSGSLGGLSMGYKTLRHRFEGKARHLAEVLLHEISLVTVPMNPLTRIIRVKDITGGGDLPSLPQFEDFLREAGGFSKSQATAIAGKGLAHLLRGEPGDASAAEEDVRAFYRGLLA